MKPTCAHCGGGAPTRMVSLVSFKIARRGKYSDEFLAQAKPFLKTQKATAGCFADGQGSDDSKTFQLADQIGMRIDRTLALANQATKRKS